MPQEENKLGKGMCMYLGTYVVITNIENRPVPKQDSGKSVFGTFPSKFVFYSRNGTHKQYSLLDTVFNEMFYLGPPEIAF